MADGENKKYLKFADIQLIDYTGGEEVKRKHLTPVGEFLIDKLKKKRVDYKIIPSNGYRGFKTYLSQADILISRQKSVELAIENIFS